MQQLTLKQLRTKCDVTQQEIADKLGISKNTYGLYERGEITMPAYIFSGICDYYNVSRDKVKIPNCKQVYKHEKPMGNIEKTTSYLYKTGFKDGYNKALQQCSSSIERTIKDLAK